jgi:Putative auto-transporter adhesin, head GIN domain
MKMNLCFLSVAGALSLASLAPVVYAQTTVTAPGADVSVSGKGVSVKVPGVSINVDGGVDTNDPNAAKKGAAKAPMKSTAKSAGGAAVAVGASTGGKCIDGVLRVVNSGTGDSKYTSLSCARVEILVLGAGHVTVSDIAAKTVSFKMAGTGDLKVGKISTDQLDVNSEASGHVMIDSGSAPALNVALSGTGDLNAKPVIAQNVKAELSGSGHALVHAAQSLTANLSGTGDLRYVGAATIIAVNNSGAGTVSKF